MSMKKTLIGFRDCEDGAATVDFVVLTGAIVLFAVALMSTGMFGIRGNLENSGTQIGNRVNTAVELSAPND